MQAILTNFVVDIKKTLPFWFWNLRLNLTNVCYRKNIGGKLQTQIVALTINTTKVTKRKKTAQTDCLLLVLKGNQAAASSAAAFSNTVSCCIALPSWVTEQVHPVPASTAASFLRDLTFGPFLDLFKQGVQVYRSLFFCHCSFLLKMRRQTAAFIFEYKNTGENEQLTPV